MASSRTTNADPPKPGRAGNPGESARAEPASVIANGQPTPATFPCTLEQFLVAQGLPPRSVVVEHNGDAVAPSEFATRPLAPGDRLEIVRIVAGG